MFLFLDIIKDKWYDEKEHSDVFFKCKKHILKRVENLKKLARFLVGVKKEVKKIRWSNKKEMLTYSTATILFVLLFGIFFAGLDVILSALKQVVA